MLICVLSDGETWTSLADCLIMDVDDDIDASDVKDIARDPGISLVAELLDVDGKLAFVIHR